MEPMVRGDSAQTDTTISIEFQVFRDVKHSL